MTLQRFAPAMLAATVLISGFVSVQPAQAEYDPRITSVDELRDVNSNHWGFDALRELVSNKCDVIEGYPDQTFKGDRRVTRWEMAAALRDILDCVNGDVSKLASQSDLETLSLLQDEFKNELAALASRATALESRAAAIEAKNLQQDVRLTLLEKTQIHGDVSIGLLARSGGGAQFGDDEDNINGIARLRLAMDVPVLEDSEDGALGEGRVHTRLIAATGLNGSTSPGFAGQSRIAADTSQTNQGLGTGNFASTDNRLNLYVERLYYAQDLNPGIPVLTDLGLSDGSEEWEASGTAFIGLAPWRDFFDKSRFRGDELTQFQNTALVNIPGVPSNSNAYMVGYKMKQGLGAGRNFELTLAGSHPNTDDVLNTWTVNYEGRLNYTLFDELGGSVYAGGFHTFNNGDSAAQGAIGTLTASNGAGLNGGALVNDTNNGLYLAVEQEVYKGAGFNVAYTFNEANSNGLLLNSLNPVNGNGFNTALTTRGTLNLAASPRQALTAVAHVPLEAVAPGLHDGDHFGVGYAVMDFDGNAGSTTDYSHNGEVYYTYYLNDQVSFVPSVQINSSRLGLAQNEVSYGIGFRTNIKF